MPTTSRSIRLSLVAAALITIAAAMTAAGWGLVVLFEHHVERRVVTALEADMGELLAGMTVADNGTVSLARRPTDPRYGQPFSGSYWQVEAAGDVVHRSRSLWDETLALPDDEPAGGVHEHVVSGPQGRPVVAVERAIRVERASGTVPIRFVVAQDRAETIAAVRNFGSELAVMLLVLGGLLLVAFALAVGIGLAPLGRLRSDLADLRTGTTKRLKGSYPREVAVLVDDLNMLLDARERAAERHRQRAADLAHGLKTPITAISGIADELAGEGQGELARELQDYTSNMLRHVERELALARSSYSGAATAPTPVKPLVEALVRSLERLPRGRELSWTVDVPGSLALRIDPTALAEIFGGLLDNARKWAGKSVRVNARTEGDKAIVQIADDGPGAAESELASLTARGRRLDQKQPGWGLGLAIAAEIVDELGGELSLANAPSGGLVATVSLPMR